MRDLPSLIFSFIAVIVIIININIGACQESSDDDTLSQSGAAPSPSLHPVEAFAVPNIGQPGVLFYNLMSSNQAEVRVRVNCLARTTSYQVEVFTSNPRVATIQGENSYNISCGNATRSPEIVISGTVDNQTAAPGHNISAGVKDAGRYDLPGSSRYVGQVSGHFNVTVEASRIGRSFFVITAKKLSGPDHAGRDKTGDVQAQSKGQESPGSERRLHKDQVGLSMVVVMQLPRTIDTVFRIILRCVIVMATAGMGLKVDVKVVRQVLKKPVGPVIGFCCQFICMPLVSSGGGGGGH